MVSTSATDSQLTSYQAPINHLTGMFLISLILFFLALTVHEYAHGWAAYKLGDPTAKYHGRLTFNPLSHIDPFGTVILPFILLLSGSPVVFGWARPVPVNFSLLGNPKKDMLWVGLAGPAANFIFACALAAVLKFSVLSGAEAAAALLSRAIIINLILGIFNLIPLPPLDGSRIALSLLPRKAAMKYLLLEPYGMLIIFGLLWLGAIGSIIWPLVIFAAKLLGVR